MYSPSGKGIDLSFYCLQSQAVCVWVSLCYVVPYVICLTLFILANAAAYALRGSGSA